MQDHTHFYDLQGFPPSLRAALSFPSGSLEEKDLILMECNWSVFCFTHCAFGGIAKKSCCTHSLKSTLWDTGKFSL